MNGLAAKPLALTVLRKLDGPKVLAVPVVDLARRVRL
jgi:hypothetical protein